MNKRVSRELEYGRNGNTDDILYNFSAIIFSAESFLYFFRKLLFEVTKIFDCSGSMH